MLSVCNIFTEVELKGSISGTNIIIGQIASNTIKICRLKEKYKKCDMLWQYNVCLSVVVSLQCSCNM